MKSGELPGYLKQHWPESEGVTISPMPICELITFQPGDSPGAHARVERENHVMKNFAYCEGTGADEGACQITASYWNHCLLRPEYRQRQAW
jgi:hypothetical protein